MCVASFKSILLENQVHAVVFFLSSNYAGKISSLQCHFPVSSVVFGHNLTI